MSVLLDSNVLIAMVVTDHLHHDVAEEWFVRLDEPFATCPITQGALLRLVLRNGGTADQARSVLVGITEQNGHEFWPDDLGYADVALTGVIGHRQVTDAYLAGLARARGAWLATLDQGLAALHPDVAALLPAPGPQG